MAEQTKENYEDLQLYRIRHSTAHIMAEAVLELYPEAKMAIGPPIETGSTTTSIWAKMRKTNRSALRQRTLRDREADEEDHRRQHISSVKCCQRIEGAGNLHRSALKRN